MRQEASAEQDKYSKLSWSVIRRLLALAAPHRSRLIVAGLLMLVSTGISLSLPLLVRYAVNEVVNTHSVANLDRFALMIVGVILVSSVFGYLQFVMTAFTGNRVVNDMRLQLFSHMQRMPVAFFDRSRSGDLTSHLSNDVGLLQTTLTDDLVKMVAHIVTLIGGTILVFVIDWRLTLVVLALMVSVMGGFVFFGRKLRKLTRQTLDTLAEAMGTMTEALANARLVKAFVREPHEDARAGERLSSVFRLAMRSSVWEAMMSAVGGSGFMLVLLGVLWYGGRAVLHGTQTVGDLLAFLMTITIISGPMASLASQYSRLQRAMGAADRIFSILDGAPEEPDLPDAVPYPVGPGEVVYDRVEFHYVADTPVLRGMTLVIPAGKVTAIVGPSGSGKSTIASLLYRFYEPQSGEIRVDGVPVRRMKRDDLRLHIGLVPQEPVLFNGTIRDNIRYGRLEASDEEVEKAAKEANVEEFVTTFPDGYETTIGERGITLSGGQRQRVAIARAMLKDPRILILDEATSALDTRSESLVREALERLMSDRTTLVIAHRLTTVQKAHQIAVVEHGLVTETGTHEELLARGGAYAGLHELLPSA